MQASQTKNDTAATEISDDFRSLVSKLVEVIQISQRLVRCEALAIASESPSPSDEFVVFIDELPHQNLSDEALLDCHFLLNDALRRLLCEHKHSDFTASKALAPC